MISQRRRQWSAWKFARWSSRTSFSFEQSTSGGQEVKGQGNKRPKLRLEACMAETSFSIAWVECIEAYCEQRKCCQIEGGGRGVAHSFNCAPKRLSTCVLLTHLFIIPLINLSCPKLLLLLAASLNNGIRVLLWAVSRCASVGWSVPQNGTLQVKVKMFHFWGRVCLLCLALQTSCFNLVYHSWMNKIYHYITSV